MLNLKELLELRGFDVNKKIKIARHKDTRKDIDVHELMANGEFELYQSYQEKNMFKDCDYLISCIGIPNNHALFVGVYKVNKIEEVNGFPDVINVSFRGKAKLQSRYKYDLEKVNGYEDFEGRIIIKWNENGQAWCVKLNTSEKEVIQILPKAFVREFPGYNQVKLFYWEMKAIVDDPASNVTWHKMLSSVNAVYLIVDTTDGKQYVGSASGKGGLFGRWKDYAKNGHGGNKLLQELLKDQPERMKKFRFSILQTYPSTFTRAEIIKEEMNYIDKLGTRATGLNW